MSTKAKIVVLSGPSGVGKGTVHAALRRSNPLYALSVSVTTRLPREGEEEGVHYFFRTQEEFDRMVREDAFVEHATIYGNSYGTPKSELVRITEGGRHVLLDIEFEGALNIKRAFPEAILIFLLPPSLEELHRRIVSRGSESPESLQRRYGQAVNELQYARYYDYMLVNADVDECVNQINWIVRSEQSRVLDNLHLIEDLKGGKVLC